MKISLRRKKIPASSDFNAERIEPRHLNPSILFLIIFLLYNLLGLINTPWTVGGAYDKTVCWELFLTALSGFGITTTIFWKGQRKIVHKSTRPRTSIQLSTLLFIIFVTALAAAIILCGGIPLLQGEDRFGNSALAFNLAQLYGFWILVRTISDLESNRRIRLVQPAVYLIGVICFGYRTPILIFGIVILVYFIAYRLSIKKSIFIGITSGLCIVGFAAIFAAFRISQNYDIFMFFKNINFQYISDHPYLLPFVPALAMFDFSQDTIYKIGSYLHDYMYGGLFLSNYETFLPGKHLGARNIIGSITGARWVAGRPMSITPTLQGALYVDFGYTGVFLGFCLIAFGISHLWKKSQGWGALGRFSFCYLLTLSIMAIHNGYWDVGFVFFLFFLCIICLFDAIKMNLSPKAI